jgi:hypothetical protein
MNNYVDSISYQTMQILGHLPSDNCLPDVCPLFYPLWLVTCHLVYRFYVCQWKQLVLFIYGCYFDFHKFAREFLCISAQRNFDNRRWIMVANNSTVKYFLKQRGGGQMSTLPKIWGGRDCHCIKGGKLPRWQLSEEQCVDTQQTTKYLHMYMYIVGKCEIHEPKLYFL